MKSQFRGLLVIGFVGFAVSAPSQMIFQTGFESPTYSSGDLSGQDDWMVTPSGASGLIQSVIFQSGSQAAQLGDAASFGRAQRSISGAPGQVLVASFGMFLDDAWGAQMETDRFEAQMRVEVSGAPGTFGIEFGFLKAPVGGYETVPADASAFFIEIGSESAMMGAGYTVVDYSAVSNGWHNYQIAYDNISDIASLYVDGSLKVQAAATNDILAISNIQLQNQRWGTSPNNNGVLYFDDLAVEAVPEPASIIAIAIGIAAMAGRRKGHR